MTSFGDEPKTTGAILSKGLALQFSLYVQWYRVLAPFSAGEWVCKWVCTHRTQTFWHKEDRQQGRFGYITDIPFWWGRIKPKLVCEFGDDLEHQLKVNLATIFAFFADFFTVLSVRQNRKILSFLVTYLLIKNDCMSLVRFFLSHLSWRFLGKNFLMWFIFNRKQ